MFTCIEKCIFKEVINFTVISGMRAEVTLLMPLNERET